MQKSNSTSCKSSDARMAFTLVELLVVIGIITILIATLLPMLSRARQASEQTKCASNLNQLALAGILYANENHDLLLNMTGEGGPGPNDTIGGQTGPSYIAWDYERIAVGGLSYYSIKGGIFGKYFTNGNTTSCPAVDPGIFQNLNFGEPLTTLGMSTRLPAKSAIARSPSATLMFADTIDYALTTGTFSVCDGINPPSLAFGVDTFQGRHPGHKGNAAFLDGHVESITVQQRPQASILPKPSNANYARLMNLHIGPCCPARTDITQYTTQSSYQTACSTLFDYYFWVNKVTRAFQ